MTGVVVAGRVGGDVRIDNVRLIGRVYNIFPSAEAPRPIRAALRRRVDALLLRHRPLGGRHDELAALDAAVAAAAGGYVFVTAPSGFGKTALLAHWTIRAGDAGREPVYHFISREEGVADEQFALLSLCQQLVSIHGLTGEVPVLTPELRTLTSLLLATPPPDGRRITVVLDGLDEALGWSPGPDLFPDLPAGVCVILSARETAGVDWLTQLRLGPERVQRTLRLHALDDTEIADVFERTGERAAAYVADPGRRERVASASGGDPFYVRLLAEDVQAGEHRDGSAPPAGLHAYLTRWWEELAADVDIQPQEAYDLLGFLVVARGPLRVSDLTQVSETLQRGALVKRELGGKLRRYLVGSADAGYALCHSRFRQYLEQAVFEDETDAYRTKLVAYCGRWRETRSAYALSHYAAHLAEAGEVDNLVALLDRPWLDARLEQERSYRGFASDVDLALSLARPLTLQDVVRVGRLCLVRATAASLTAEVSDDALVALAHAGREEETLAYVELMVDVPRVVAVLRRCGEAMAARDAPEARVLIERAFDTATAVPAARYARWIRSSALVELAGAFGAAGVRNRADEAIARARAEGDMDAGRLASALVRAGRLDLAADMLREATNAFEAASPRAALVRALVDQGRHDAALQTCLGAEQPWRRVPQLVGAIEALTAAGARESAELAASELVRAGDAVGDVWFAAPLLGQVARGLAIVGRRDEAQATRDRAIACLPEGDPLHRGWAIAGIARACAQAGEIGRARELAASLELLDAPPGPAGPRSIDHATAATWREIARREARSGHVDAALEAAERAQAAERAAERGPTSAIQLELPELSDDEWQSEPIDDVIVALVEGGEVDAALEAAAGALGTEARDRRLNRAIDALVGRGDHTRARDGAARLADDRSRAHAYGRIAVALASGGDALGEQIADEALRLAHANNAPWMASWAAAGVAQAFAAEHPDRADAVVEDITALDVRAWATLSIARERLAAGDPEGAVRGAERAAALAVSLARGADPPEPVARTRMLHVTDSDQLVMGTVKRPKVLSPLAEHALGGGLHVGSRYLSALSNPISLLMPHVVDVLVGAERHDRAAEVAQEMLDVAVGLQDRMGPATWAAVQATAALARAGRYEEALSLASRLSGPVLSAQAHAAVAGAMVTAGLAERAGAALEDAIEAVRRGGELPQRDEMVEPVVAVLLRLGDVDRAIEVAGSDGALLRLLLTSPGQLAAAVGDLAGADRRESAESLVAEARQAAAGHPGHLADVAQALGTLGRVDEQGEAIAEARATAGAYPDPQTAVDALTRLADLLAERGAREAATATLHEADRALPEISDIQKRDRMRAAVASRLAEHDSGAAARAALRAAVRPAARAHALLQLIPTLFGRGREAEATAVAAEIVEVAERAGDHEEAAYCWTSAAFALGRTGDGGGAAMALLNAWLSASVVSRSTLLDVMERSAPIVVTMQNGMRPGDVLWELHCAGLDVDAWWSAGRGEAGATAGAV